MGSGRVGNWCGCGSARNPRRLRRERFTILCGCDCHSSCLVTNEKNTMGDLPWRQSCTCPGAEAAAIAAHLDSYPTGARFVAREVVSLGKQLGSFRRPR